MGPRGWLRAGGRRQRRDRKTWARAFTEVSKGRRQGGRGEGHGSCPYLSATRPWGDWGRGMEPQTGGGWGWEVRMHWSACENPKGESCPLELVNPGRGSPFRVSWAPRCQSIRIQKSKGLIMQAGR